MNQVVPSLQSNAMDEEDDDDFYAPEGSEAIEDVAIGGHTGAGTDQKAVGTSNGEDEEEGEEVEGEGEDSDSVRDMYS